MDPSTRRSRLNSDDEPFTTDEQPEPVGTRRRRQKLGRAAAAVASDVAEELAPPGTVGESVWTDGPLALTLLPPIGSYLTGGDFIRDGLILALLFYYLRALIQTPWELYINARARRPHPSLVSQYDDVAGEDQVEEHESIRHRRAAALSELRFAELIYLSLCLATPLIGTMLLRYVSTLLSTDGTITWFSSGLFVLAAGIRPWRHFINLLTSRTVDLHDIVHAPPNGVVTPASVSQERLDGLERSLAELAEGMKSMKQRLAGNAKELKTVHARVEESVEHVEGQVRNVVRAGEVGRLESDSRLEEMQRKISSLQHQLQSGNIRPSYKAFDTDHGKPGLRAGTLTPTTPDPIASYVLNHLTPRRVLTDKIPLFSSRTNFKTSVVSWVVHLVLWPVRLSQGLLSAILRVLGLVASADHVYDTEIRGGIVVGRKQKAI